MQVDKLNKPMRENRKGVTFSKDDKYIYVVCKAGLTFVCNYEKELYKLLTNRRIRYTDESKGNYYRLRSMITYGGKKSNTVQRLEIYHLIYGYYFYGVRVKNLISSLEQMTNDLRDRGLSVDHLDNNRLNNTIANLSLVAKGVNSSKGNSFDKITQEPYKLVMAHKDNRFKACIFWLNGGFIFVNPVITANSPESLLTTVKLYMKVRPFDSYESVVENYNKDKAKQISEGERANDIDLQRILFENFDNSLVGFRIACTFAEQRGLTAKVTIVETTQMYNTY